MNASLKLLHRLTAATVGLEARIPESHPSTVVLGTERQGSGVVLEPSKLVLTVNYLTLGAESLTVFGTGGTRIPARVVAQDFASGIALLGIDGRIPTGLPPRHSSGVPAGSEIVVVASTGGGDRRVADGAVLSLAPFDANWEYSLDRALILTTQSPGFGGAPICDLLGNVLGVTFLDTGEVGRFTLGIPVDPLLDHQEELLQHGRRITRPTRAWIGCFCYTIRDHVVIAGVLPGGPAERAGLRPGDVLIDIDDERIRDRRQLYHHLWEHRPGGQLEFRVYRDDGVRSVTVTTGNAEEFFS